MIVAFPARRPDHATTPRDSVHCTDGGAGDRWSARLPAFRVSHVSQLSHGAAVRVVSQRPTIPGRTRSPDSRLRHSHRDYPARRAAAGPAAAGLGGRALLREGRTVLFPAAAESV